MKVACFVGEACLERLRAALLDELQRKPTSLSQRRHNSPLNEASSLAEAKRTPLSLIVTTSLFQNPPLKERVQIVTEVNAVGKQMDCMYKIYWLI
jgi:hypothetical protein